MILIALFSETYFNKYIVSYHFSDLSVYDSDELDNGFQKIVE